MKLQLVLASVLAVCSMVEGQGFPTSEWSNDIVSVAEYQRMRIARGLGNCPAGEHSVLYCPQKAEPSCTNPKVHDLESSGKLCDVPQCFCNTPTVRNEKNGKCVKLEDCPKVC